MRGFIDFIREKGVVGLAVGLVLGSAIAKFVSSIVTDIVSPFISMFTGKADLQTWVLTINHAQFRLGDLLSNLIDFLSVAAVIYIFVVKLGLDKLDKKKT